MGIDLATWRARIGLNYYHMCRPLQTRWRSSGGQLYQSGVASWGVGEVMNDTPLVLKGCMTVVALSLILQYVVHSWSKVKGQGRGGKVRCHWRETTSQVRGTMDGGGIFLLKVVVVVIPLLLVIAGDVERNPGPGELSLKALLNELHPVRANWYNIGLQLNVPYTTLDSFRQLYSDPSSLLCEMLKHWLKTAVDPRPTWEAVVTALRSPMVNEKSVAVQLEAKYCTPVQHVMERTSLASPAVVTTARSSDSTTSPPPSEGSQKLPFGCGCGKCTFFNFIESGCPTPIPSASSFPYLDLSGLTHEQQQELRERLRFESLQIMIRFQGLVSATIKSLIRQNVPLDELVSHVMTQGALDPVFKEPQVPLFQYCFTKLESADTIPKVFLVLKDYFSFFNYHIIEYIIKELGTAEDKAKLQKYNEDFNQYAKRRIFECPPEFGPVSNIDYADIFVIVDAQYDNYTVAEIEGFRHKLSEIINVSSQGILRLCRVVKFGFHVPKKEASADKPQLGIDTSDEERHLAALKLAIQQKGLLDKTIMQCAFVGPPRSGKSSLMKRIVGERPTPSSTSTGVVNKVVQVVVKSSADASDSTWDKLSHDDEAVMVVMDASQVAGDETHLQATVPIKAVPPTEHHTALLDDSVTEQGKHQAELSKSSSANSDVVDPKLAVSFCRSALQRNLQNAEKILRDKGWLVYLTDTGGQIEFQELLPVLVSGPSLFFLVFRLDHDLNQRFTVEYVRPNVTLKSYLSTFTVKEALLQSLASIASMATYINRGGEQVPLISQVFFVGTHKDRVSDQEIDRIDRALQDLVTTTGLYRKGIIQFGTESRMLLAVNNLSDDDSDVQLVRAAVERLGRQGGFNVRAPPSWLIFSLIIRQQEGRILSYEQCFEVARQCGIMTQGELNETLWFLHTKVGLIRHFQGEGLEDLQKIVIQDPQVLFDMITDLVVETFTFYKANPVVWENFKKKGIFPFSTFERISGNSGHLLTPSRLVNLLEHLHIIAPLEEEGEKKYFMPCVLSPAQPAEAISGISGEQPAEPGSNNSSLLIGFTCGYCPKGLFAALVVYLLANRKGRFQWRLQCDRIFKDQISFSVGPYDTVLLTVQPKYFEISCTPELSHDRRSSLATVCVEVRRCIETGISEVTSSLHYAQDTHYLAFYCPGDHQGPHSSEPHPAEIIDIRGNTLSMATSDDIVPCTLRCELAKGKVFKLPPGHERWFTKPTVLEHPDDQSVHPGTKVVFRVKGTGDDIQFQWQKNRSDLCEGGRYCDTNTDTLQIFEIEKGDKGRYRCLVKNKVGRAFSNEALLTINDDITAPTSDTTESTIKTLLEELEDISGSEWFKLGHWLGVKDSTLRDIEANHKGDVWRCKREMLCAWLQSSPTFPWVKLATTLKCMGNEVLAQKILEKYTTP